MLCTLALQIYVGVFEDHIVATISVPSLYRRFEKGKYEQRIREVELSSFVPLVFSTFGGMSGCTHVVYKRLAYAPIKIMPHYPPPGQGGDFNFTNFKCLTCEASHM